MDKFLRFGQFPVNLNDEKLIDIWSININIFKECIDFCAAHKIVPEIKLIKAGELDMVYESLQKKNDQITRYVLDVTNSL